MSFLHALYMHAAAKCIDCKLCYLAAACFYIDQNISSAAIYIVSHKNRTTVICSNGSNNSSNTYNFWYEESSFNLHLYMHTLTILRYVVKQGTS